MGKIMNFILLIIIVSACKNEIKSSKNVLKKEHNTLISSTKKAKVDIIKAYTYDINSDGITDSIYVYKNHKYASKFEEEHFGLGIKIVYSKNKYQYKKVINNNLIPRFDDACISEGFSKIEMKNNQFTIVGQSCRGHWILVHYSITFIYRNDNFVLGSYTEKYFDRVTHNRKIPPKTWNSKIFDNPTFNMVKYELFIKQSNQYLKGFDNNKGK